jgi:preprotein translocase subunit SecD
VLSEIPNGAATISGVYTMDECKLLSIGLKSNKLPAKLSIASSTVKPDDYDYNLNRKLLVAFITFVVAAGIAFFIFKTLKST